MNNKIELVLNSPNNFFAYKPADASKVAMLLPCANAYTELVQRNIHFYIKKEYLNGRLNLEINFWENYTNLESYHIPTLMIQMLNINLVDLLISLIQLEHYITIPVDSSKIHLYPNYGTGFSEHPILISGYDKSNRTFTVSDYFNYSYGKFTTTELAFDELEAGFESILNYIITKRRDEIGWLSMIEILYVNNNIKRTMNLERLSISLKNYMEGKNSWGEKGNDVNVFCGFDIYDLSIEYINDIIENELDYIDIKMIYVLELHFRLLKMQSEYISGWLTNYSTEFKQFEDDFQKCEEEAKQIVMLSLKYNANRKNNILSNIIERIKKLKNVELNYTNKYIRFIDDIENNKKEGHAYDF
ncbi:MAG: hypothetical protein K0S76_869 [Herbinix sp.]|jgi:hypothetical protein|nr:hypothetical protein [Herbinix sp.]